MHSPERQDETPTEGAAAQGREIVYWIAKAARAAREETGATRTKIAGDAGVVARTVERFEDIKSFPRELDEIIAAIAELAGLEDEREIYQRALDMWLESGVSLVQQRRIDNAATPGKKIEEEVRQNVQRDRQRDARESAAASTTTRKKRASR